MANTQLPAGLLSSMAMYTHIPTKKISGKIPLLYTTAVLFHRTKRHLKNYMSAHASIKKDEFFTSVLCRHQSLLMKKLGDNNEHLQRQKITNLRVAAEKISGIVIQPGETFSYWNAVGEASKKRGFEKGMLLSKGKVVEGVGGGLCQLSNLLYWMFLHGPFQIKERYHHSYDVFPDSGRVLPFGSGATVFYNYVDLVVKNISDKPIQIKLWLTDTHLKGQLVSESAFPEKYSVLEEEHLFLHWNKQWFRYNELYKDTLVKGEHVYREFVTKNFAPVLYNVSEQELRERGYRVEMLE